MFSDMCTRKSVNNDIKVCMTVRVVFEILNFQNVIHGTQNSWHNKGMAL